MIVMQPPGGNRGEILPHVSVYTDHNGLRVLRADVSRKIAQ